MIYRFNDIVCLFFEIVKDFLKSIWYVFKPLFCRHEYHFNRQWQIGRTHYHLEIYCNKCFKVKNVFYIKDIDE